MAITHINTQAADSNSSTTSLAFTITTDVLANDILVLACVNRGATSAPSTPTDDESGGNAWASLQSSNNGTSGESIWWKRIVADNTSTITVAVAGFTDSCAGVLSIYRGCSTDATPYEEVMKENNISGNETQEGIIPTVDGSVVCFYVFNGTNDITTTSRTAANLTLTDRGEHLNTGGNDCAVGHSSAVQTTAGDTGAITWSQANAASMSLAFAIKPLGATVYTLTAAVTAFTFTGIGVNLTLAWKLVTSVTAFIFTGVDTTFSITRKLTAAKIDYIISPKTAMLSPDTAFVDGVDEACVLLYPAEDVNAGDWILSDESDTYCGSVDDPWPDVVNPWDWSSKTMEVDAKNIYDTVGTIIFGHQLKLLTGRYIPKSAGYFITPGAGTIGMAYCAKRADIGAGTARIRAGLKIANDWRYFPWNYPSTSDAWFNDALNTVSYETGPMIDLYGTTNSTMYSIFEVGSVGVTKNTYLEAAAVELQVYYDAHVPHAPGTLYFAGYKLPFDHINAGIATPTVGTLSLIYRDITDALFSDGYDETTAVQWQIGTGKSGSGDNQNIIGTIADSGRIATIASLDSYVVVSWPFDTALVPRNVYYVRARAFDANYNHGAWSSVHQLILGSGSGYAWWHSDWTRRAEIQFGNNHGTLNSGYTANVAFNSGVIKCCATNGFENDAVSGESARHGDKTYFSWRSGNPAAIYVNYYNHTTAGFGTVVKVCDLNDVAIYDAHYYPVINICGSNYIHVVVSGHHSDMPAYRSTNKLDHNSWGYICTIGQGTYPRLIKDKYGRLLCLYRGAYNTETWVDNKTHAYRSYNAKYGTWGANTSRKCFLTFKQDADNYSNPSLNEAFCINESDTVYCLGAKIDKNNNLHFAYNFVEYYGATNKGRAVGYTWASLKGGIEDHITTGSFYSIAGSYMGKAVQNLLHYGSMISMYNNGPISGIGLVYKAPNFTSSIASMIGPFPCANSQGLDVFPSGTVCFIWGNASLQGSYTPRFVPCDYMMAMSSGQSWATINITKQSGSPRLWEYRYAAAVFLLDSPYYDNKVIKLYGTIIPPTTQSWFGGEIGEWYSLDNGQNWGYKYLTKNSYSGFPVVIGMASHYNSSELVITRGTNIDYWNGGAPGTTFKLSGDDIRVVYGTKQIDRVPANFFNYENTILNFKVQSTIGRDISFPTGTPYFLYYGNYFCSATPPANVNNVFRFFEGWENYSVNDMPTHSMGGWYVIPTAYTYNHLVPYLIQSSKSLVGETKLYSGYKSLIFDYNSSNPPCALVRRTIPTTSNFYEISYAYRMEQVGGAPTYNSPCKFSLKSDNPLLGCRSTIRNYEFTNSIVSSGGTTWPANWTCSRGNTVLRSSTWGSPHLTDTYSARLTTYATYAYIISTIITSLPGRKLKFNCNIAASTDIGGLSVFPTISILTGKGTILGAVSYEPNENVKTNWDLKAVAVSTVSPTGKYRIKFFAPRYTGASSAYYIDNINWTVPTFCYTVVQDDENRQMLSSNASGSLVELSHATFWYRTAHVNRVIIGTSIKLYTDGKLTGHLATFDKTTFPNIIATMYFKATQTEYYLDHIIVRDYVDQVPSCLPTRWFISDYVGDIHVANYADLAYIRAKRLSAISDLAYVRTAEIPNLAYLEIRATKQIANIVSLSYTALKRIANYLIGEKVSTERLALFLQADKYLCAEIANIINADKEIYNKVSNISNVIKIVCVRLSNMVLTDKQFTNRVSNILLGEKEDYIRLSQFMQADKELKQRIANEILGNKHIYDRVASYITTDKEVAVEIANIIQGDKLLTQRLSNLILGNKEVYLKFANILLGDKEFSGRIANVLQGERSEEERLSMLAELDKELAQRIAVSVAGDKEIVHRIASRVSGDKMLISRIANIVLMTKMRTGEIANIVQIDKENIYRLALGVFGDKEVATKIANQIILEDVLTARIMNYIISNKFFTSRVSHLIRGDKEFAYRLSNEAIAIKELLGQFVEAVDLEATRQKRLSEMVTLLIQKMAHLAIDVDLSKDKQIGISEFVTIEKIMNDAKFDQFVDLVALKMGVFSQKLDFAKDFYKKLAEIVQLQKENFDNRYVQIIDFIAHEMLAFSEDTAFIADKIKGFAENVEFIESILAYARFAEMVSLDKVVLIRFVESLGLDKITTDKIVEDIRLNKADKISLSEIAALQKTTFGRFIEDAAFRREFVTFFAETTGLSKIASMGIAESINFLSETVGTYRFTEQVLLEEIRYDRLSEGIGLLANKMGKFSEMLNLISTDLISFSENTDFSKLQTKYGFAQYIQLSAEELLTQRIAAFIEFSAIRRHSITEFINFIKVSIPELVFVRNYSVVRSGLVDSVLTSSNLEDMEIV